MSDCVNKKTDVQHRLEIEHQTARDLDRMEHKVLLPGCKHDSHTAFLQAFPCLYAQSPAKSPTTADMSGTEAEEGIGDRVVMDSHSDAR